MQIKLAILVSLSSVAVFGQDVCKPKVPGWNNRGIAIVKQELAVVTKKAELLENAKGCSQLQLAFVTQVKRIELIDSLALEYNIDSPNDPKACEKSLLADIPNITDQLQLILDIEVENRPVTVSEVRKRQLAAYRRELIDHNRAAQLSLIAQEFLAEPKFTVAETKFGKKDWSDAKISGQEGHLGYYLLPGLYCGLGSVEVSQKEVHDCYRKALTEVASATPEEVYRIFAGHYHRHMKERDDDNRAYLGSYVRQNGALEFFCKESNQHIFFTEMCASENPAPGCEKVDPNFVKNFGQLSKICEYEAAKKAYPSDRAVARKYLQKIRDKIEATDKVLSENGAGNCAVPTAEN